MARILRLAIILGALAAVTVVGRGAVQAAGKLAGHVASLPGVQMGTSHALNEAGWLAYYDGHKDTYVNTDVSTRSQAHSLGINYSAALAHTLGASSPMYFVKGRAASGQIAVFGSEPGESSYSPLWREVWVTWKPGKTPVLLKRDDQIKSLASAGKLTMKLTSIVLNAPVTNVGH